MSLLARMEDEGWRQRQFEAKVKGLGMVEFISAVRKIIVRNSREFNLGFCGYMMPESI